MYDGSALPIEENIKNTQEVVAYAHAHGVSVEGEIGSIGGAEEGVVVEKTLRCIQNQKMHFIMLMKHM